jgi:nucleoside-diphosphate-sugar epimerase
MRVLLTGSSGWLGRFLAPKLRTAGHSVIGLDVVAGEFTDMVGSVADRAVVERVLADHAIEAAIHAGALHKPDIARFPPQAFVDVNVTGTLNVAQWRPASLCARSRLCLAVHEALTWLISTASFPIWSPRSIPPAISATVC